MATHQFDMTSARLPKVFRAGCATIRGADKFPLAELIYDSEPGNVSLTFWGDAPKPWDDVSIANVHMFQFPKGRSEFDQLLEWFGKERKSRVKLPEGVKFEPSTLAVSGIPKDWEHDAFARSGRDLFHAYRGPKAAVFVRLMCRSGTVLDHPLLAPLIRGLTIDEKVWERAVPTPRIVSGLLPKVSDRALPKSLRKEIEASAAVGRESLKLKKRASRSATIDAIREAVARSSRKENAAANQMAIDFGALWGETLCAAAGWEWRLVTKEDDAAYPHVCSPDRAQIVSPIHAVLAAIRSRNRSGNNLAILFNLIVAGKLPESPPKSYLSLS